jgi:hypothetical protein
MVLTVQQSYIKAQKSIKDSKLKLTSILDFGLDFGFLFGDAKGNILFGSSYILINKKTGAFNLLPTTPHNLKKLQSAKKIPLTIIKIQRR